ncbi:OLC1v1022650C1 [Oldenlandia corymbosa var. corymbosa]|uniref:OLC1v1022650C1 n=1 Tax=Oldenlandia corymbosa var. corymbosa TaxID=529605 RepID=A0AAV1BY99_OLDCO|nr:OLC1v1022650C1 [Oldenlandia corymbosa var. corymbosa]
MCNLSKEVLALIADNLCFVDYMHFRCVNKLCASSTIRMRSNPFPPCLIYKDRSAGVYNILDSNLNHKICVKIPELLKDYQIRCSRNGCLLLEYNKDLAFFNPLTMHVLPAGGAPITGRGILNYTFLSKSSSSGCSILAMSRHGIGGVSFSVTRISGSVPKCRSFVVGEQGHEWVFNKGCNSPVVLGEFCYHLGGDGMLGRGQLTQDQDEVPLFHWQVFEDIVYPDIKFRRNYLTERGGELISILLHNGNDHSRKRPWVRVFKLKEHKEWEEIDTLEGSIQLNLTRNFHQQAAEQKGANLNQSNADLDSYCKEAQMIADDVFFLVSLG